MKRANKRQELLRRQKAEMRSRERKSDPRGHCFNDYPNGADLTRWENDEKSQQKAGTAQTTEG
ncbi:hypothetical protein PMJ10TS2_45200 [Paenibacillus melissococcoides]